MNRFLPALDLLAHNAVAVLIAMPLLILLAQLVVAIVLRISKRVLGLSVFRNVVAEDRTAFRRGVQRRALGFVLLVGVLLLIGAVVMSYRGVRALDQVNAAREWVRTQDLSVLRARGLGVVGLLIGVFLVDGVARALIGAIGKGLSGWSRLEAHQKALPDVVVRLQSAVRAVAIGFLAVAIVTLLDLPEGAVRSITLIADAIGVFYISRALSRIWRLLTDIFSDLSNRFSSLEGPIKALGDLKRLTGVTKRAGDYLIYVGGATWFAGQISSAAWYYDVGQIGLKLIIIFYASRVLVEVCVLLVQELFIGKLEELTEAELQRRKTLLPVMLGFLRYGIYFTGLIMALRAASIDPTPLLAGAGVIGVAIGFGAQTFVGDIVAGFFILFEDMILMGDLVEVGGIKGNVEEIGVRITRIRDDSGVLHSIPNGEVRKVANHSREHVNAIVDVYVPYEEDPQRIRSMLAMLTEKTLIESGMKRGPVEVKVQELAEAAVLFRIIANVPPGQDDNVSDELRAMVVTELRTAKVGAPRPRRAVIIDAGLRVSGPPAGSEEEEPAGPPNPFKPAESES